MRALRRILTPIDFSAPAREALRYAADLARRSDASLTLLHVFQRDPGGYPEGYRPLDPEQLARLLADLERTLAEAKQAALVEGVRAIDTHLVYGTPAGEIVAFAREGSYDLIVMGTHGRTGLAHVLLGSVAEQVVRRAPCAVLTVREQPIAAAA